jgi:WD40 repeat protein
VSNSDEDKCVKIWDAVTGADLTAVGVKALSVSESYKFEKNYSSSYIARFDKDLYGSRIVSILGEKSIAVYDSFLCSKILEFEGTSEASLVLLHQDGKRIITGCKDGNLTIWDITVY